MLDVKLRYNLLGIQFGQCSESGIRQFKINYLKTKKENSCLNYEKKYWTNVKSIIFLYKTSS